MGLSSFLDVAIGLGVMYLTLSLICTIIHELITTVRSVRAKTLAQTMKTLIDDPKIRDAFYNHGLITNAAQASRTGSGEETKTGEKYVPADPKHPSYFDPRTVALALLDSLDPDNDAGQKGDFPDFKQVKDLVAALPDSNIRDVLLSSLAGNGDLAKVRADLEAWFETAMDRLSGGYKRWAKKVALGVGIAVAVVMNADSLHVAKALWVDETLRSQMVSAASSMVENGDVLKAPCVPDAPASPTPPAPAAPADTTTPADTSAPNETAGQEDPAKKIGCLLGNLRNEQARLRPLPIGWTRSELPGWKWESVSWGVLKLFGLLITGLALSLGAPFWFDLLQKFMNIRGAKPEEKKGTAAPSVVVNNAATPIGSAPPPLR